MNPLPASGDPLASWFMAGFEGSTLKFNDGRRVDAIASSGHDRHCLDDYQRLARLGIRSVRDALRWHLIEAVPGEYHWESARPMLEAAAHLGTQVVWDLCHFGVPDHVDIFSPGFPAQLADFAEAAAKLRASLSDAVPWWAPVNEISYWAWAGGRGNHFWPGAPERDDELKDQLIRASIAATRRLREVDPRARFVATDPLIHITDGGIVNDRSRREREYGFHAWDALSGARRPDLGGDASTLDVVGVNYYARNQWLVADRRPVGMGDWGYRPLRMLLQDVWDRYQRPIMISETGAEAPNGPGWLRYVAGEARAAMSAGVEVVGLCVYPCMDYFDWVNGRQCPCGFISFDTEGNRFDSAEMAGALDGERSRLGSGAAG